MCFDEEHVATGLQEFLEIRSSLQVLSELVIPEFQLTSFIKSHSQEHIDEDNCSIPFSLFKVGKLHSFCNPLHDFIFNRNGGRDALLSDYRGSLMEKWYQAPDPDSRFAQRNQFMGKIVEFHTAHFLEEVYGWNVLNMEAFTKGPCPDVLLQDVLNEVQLAVSVKTLFRSPEIFRLFRSHTSNTLPSSVFMSPYAPVNYLFYRICEGAWGLEGWRDYKRVLVINLTEMLRFNQRLDLDWLDFDNLRFIHPDESLHDFWATRARERNQAAETLARMSDHVDGILICHVSPTFDIKPIRTHWYR